MTTTLPSVAPRCLIRGPRTTWPGSVTTNSSGSSDRNRLSIRRNSPKDDVITRTILRPARKAASLVLSCCLAPVAAGCSITPADSTVPGPTSNVAQPAELDGRSLPPWPAPADAEARVAAAGLDLGPMGRAEHYHPHLRIIVNGTEVPVPGNIGVDPGTGAMSAVHTHEPDGTIHIEADRAGEVFTLGQLFMQWGVRLTSTQIGGVRTKDGRKVTLTSNGEPITGRPTDLRLEPEQKIVVQLS